MLFKKLHDMLKKGFKKSTANDEDRIFDVLNWAKSQGYLDDLEISDENAETLLRSFLVERDLPEELIRNEKLRNELTEVIAKRAAESSPVRPGDAI